MLVGIINPSQELTMLWGESADHTANCSHATRYIGVFSRHCSETQVYPPPPHGHGICSELARSGETRKTLAKLGQNALLHLSYKLISG